MLSIPTSEDSQAVGLDLAILLVNEGNIDTRDELDNRRPIRIICSTFYLETVDPILMDSLRRRQSEWVANEIGTRKGDDIHVLDR